MTANGVGSGLGLRYAVVALCSAALGMGGGYLLARRVMGVPDSPGASAATGAAVTTSGTAGQPVTEKHTAASPGAGIGVTLTQFQEALDSPTSPRFMYANGGEAEGQPITTGVLGDHLAVVEVAGPPENLSRATLTLQLTNQNAETVVQSAEYLVLFAGAVSPGWQQAGKWIKESLPATAGGGVASTTRDKIRISISRIDRFGLVQMTAEPAG